MKRREPSNDRRSESERSLRAQLKRTVGDSLEALEGRVRDGLRAVLSNAKPVEVSKQRLSDVLWNDRTLLATHAAQARSAPDTAERSVAPAHVDPAVTRAPDPAPALQPLPAREPVPAASLTLPAGVAGCFESAPLAAADLALEPELLSVAERSQPEPIPEAPASAPTQPVTQTLADASAPGPAAKPELARPEPANSAPASPAPLPAEDDDDDWAEPIQTRSMARLLAGQGHRDRALAIYDALLARDVNDLALRAEADALRQP